MNFWILLWQIVFFGGLIAFILMFMFVSYKGFFEIKELLKNKTDNDLN